MARSGSPGWMSSVTSHYRPIPHFWDLPNVLINPHSASTSIHENARIVEIFIHNLQCYLDGRPSDMRNVLDIERMY